MEKWQEYKLADVCSRLRSGKGIKSDSVLDLGPYPVIGGNGIRGYANESNFKGECAVIGRQGAYCGNVRFYEGEAYMTEHAGTAFIYCYLKAATPDIENKATGSTFKEASGSLMKSLQLKIAPKDIMDSFEKRLKPIFDEQECIEDESRRLAELRDTLLPRLMSGELSVNDIKG